MSEAKLQGEYRSVGLFIENSKTYIQLSTGALLLSVTFSETVTGQSGVLVDQPYLWISWLSWLAAIIAGATYQYCAAKYLEKIEIKFGTLYHDRATPLPILQQWIKAPYKLYALLMIFFYGGTAWFALSAAYQLAVRQ